MDFITGLPNARKELQDINSIFIIIDRYTRMARFFTVFNTINAVELARLFHIKIKLKFGTPNGIISDRGPIFINNF